MEERLKERLFNIILLIIMLILLGSTFFIVKENKKCTSNPFIYGANLVYSSGPTNDLSCSCMIKDTGDKFYFNKEKFWFEDKTFNFNISN